MKVLVVDDDDISLEIVSTGLAGAGYEVIGAANGREALDVIATTDVRLVITDWDMPVMDGLQLCRAIRRHDSVNYVYLILLTSHGSSEEIVEGMSAGADDFVVKPFNKGELLERVRAGQRVLSLETREMVIFVLARLADSRDPETGHHLERVQRYCRALAQTLAENPEYRAQIDPEFVRLVFQTSPLHDIGKVGVPDSVLLKPGRLSVSEFEVMKTHTTIGADTLEAALEAYPHARFLHIARDIALSHHERWDGSGYPHGRAGTDIPLSARIVALADVYDALTSRRVYKEAFTHEVARDIIVSESGAQFDPNVVDAFIQNEAEFVEIRSRFLAPETLSSTR